MYIYYIYNVYNNNILIKYSIRIDDKIFIYLSLDSINSELRKFIFSI